MILSCVHCKASFERKRERKYCSTSCSRAALSAHFARRRGKCPVCNAQLRPKHTGVHCSRACSNVTAVKENYWGVPKWDATFRARVAELWQSGMSTVQIGQHTTPRVSKNVIVSLRRRMNLKGRPSPLNRSGSPDRYPKVRTPPRQVPRPPKVTLEALFDLAPRKAPPQPIQRAPEPRPESAGRHSPHRTCQWIFQTRPLLMCDKESVPGFSWCSEHKAIVYPRRTTPVSFGAVA